MKEDILNVIKKQFELSLMDLPVEDKRAICPRSYLSKCAFCEFIGIRKGEMYGSFKATWSTAPGVLYSWDPITKKRKYPDSIRMEVKQYQVKELIFTIGFLLPDLKQKRLFKLTYHVFQKLKNLSQFPDYKYFYDFEKGFVFALNKTIDPKTNMFTYDLIPIPTRVVPIDPSIISSMLDFEALMKITSPDYRGELGYIYTPLGAIEAGTHELRFIPVARGLDVWFIRMYIHRGISQDDLDAINEGKLDPWVFIGLEKEKFDKEIHVEDTRDDVPDDWDEGIEYSDVDTKQEDFSLECFGDPKMYRKEMGNICDFCSKESECREVIKKKIK